MGMGMPEGAPETFGLPEYYVTEVLQEVCGGDVRMVCGVKRMGQINWLFSVVIPADRLIIHSQNCKNAAVEAFNLTELMGLKTAH
jgi:hypothetical protein